MSTPFHIWLAAEMHPADGEFLASSNKQEGISEMTAQNRNIGNMQGRRRRRCEPKYTETNRQCIEMTYCAAQGAKL